MRSVRIVVRQVAGSMPALVAASVIGSSGCGEAAKPPPRSTPVAGAGGTAGASGGSSSAGSGIMIGSGASSGGSYSEPGCEGYEMVLPEVGEPASAGELCAMTIEPVMNDGSVHVRLMVDGDDVHAVTSGKLLLAPELMAELEGTPALVVVRATDPKLLAAEVSELVAEADGYSFNVTWPSDAKLDADDLTRVTFRTAFDVACESGSRLVHALTEMHLCGGYPGEPSAWASSGDTCAVCRIIAEVAASPIIPEHEKSALPLGQAMRARLVELSRVGDSVVLFAENDGGAASSYEWHVSGGTFEQIAPDVIVFRASADATPSVQVAIVSDDGAAVVSYAYTGGTH